MKTSPGKRDYAKKYYSENKKHYSEYYKSYYQKNKDKILEKQKKYNKQNRKKFTQYLVELRFELSTNLKCMK